MKKLSILIVTLFVASALFAQDLITKIPKNANFVGVYKGAKVLDLVSEKELMEYHFMKKIFEKGGDFKNFDDLGVDINANFYSFVSMTDSIGYFSILMPLKSAQKFGKTFKHEHIEPIGNFQGFSSSGTSVLWDNQSAIIAIAFGYEAPNVYDSYGYGYGEVEEVEMEEEVVVEEVEEVEMVEEEVEIAEEVEFERPPSVSQKQSPYNVWRAKRDNLIKGFALKIMGGQSKLNSIATNSSFLKSSDKKAVASFWTGSYGAILMKVMGEDIKPSYGMSSKLDRLLDVSKKLSSSQASGIKSMVGHVYLRDENVEMTLQTEVTDAMASFYRSMGKRKFNKNFFRYFDGDQVMGYFGIALNTENAIDDYPNMFSAMFGNVMPEMEAEISAGAELVSILLDAEEIGELIHGDAMFVISDVVEKEIKYSTYEYDEDFNATKVEKTRMEPMPEFLFMATTERFDFFRKIFSIGKKYKAISREHKDVFKLVGPGKIPIEVYFVLHDDILFVTSSEYQARDIADGKRGKISRKHKKKAKNQSVTFYLNNDAVLKAIPEGMLPRDVARQLDYWQSNFKDIEMTSSRVKGNVHTTSFKVNTTGKEQNVLKAFFGMIEQVGF